MLRKKSVLLLITIALVLTLVVGCSGQPDSTQQTNQNKEVINFGYVEWPGVTVKTHVVNKIAQYLGYKTKLTSAMKPTILKGMEQGDIDVFLGLWLPQMINDYQPYKEKGTVKPVRVNLDEVVWKTAVPEYVWEAGVKSMADLHKYANKFDHKWYGLEPGSSGNAIMKKAIKNNIYGLKDWNVVVSSSQAMMSAVKKHIRDKEWIAWSAWKPHWMNIVYDIKYLKDPKRIWSKDGSDKSVLTITRKGFKDDAPNFYKLLKQFKISSKIQSKWILEYGKKKRDPEKIAEEWIKNNLDLVTKWVAGMKTVDEKDAVKVIEQKFK
ncbi:ABC transporter substrate-binding protein [Selenihalanaerobacter shriftii]|nr:ABC transporter substrate-binding protein [Selenihalanaerobacter shriftii]